MDPTGGRRWRLVAIFGAVAVVVVALVIAALVVGDGGASSSNSRARRVSRSAVTTTPASTISTTPPTVPAEPQTVEEPEPVVAEVEAPRNAGPAVDAPPEEIHGPYYDPVLPTFPPPCTSGDTRPGTDADGNPVTLRCLGGIWVYTTPIK